jgi:hypothetical protein
MHTLLFENYMRTHLSAIALLVVVLLTIGAPLFAAAGSHQPCPAEPDCHKAVRITACCCCDDSETSNQPRISQARMELTVDLQPAVAALPATVEPPLRAASWSIDTYPADRRPPDLPILLADLRL